MGRTDDDDITRRYDEALRLVARMAREARDSDVEAKEREAQRRELERRLAFWQRRPVR